MLTTIGKVIFGGLLVLTMAVAVIIPVTAQDGSQIYQENCQRCHADDGKGISGANFSDPSLWKSTTKRDVVSTVKNGIEIMPSYDNKLTDEEIEAVLEYASDFAGVSYSEIPGFIPVISGFTVFIGLMGVLIVAILARGGI